MAGAFSISGDAAVDTKEEQKSRLLYRRRLMYECLNP